MVSAVKFEIILLFHCRFNFESKVCNPKTWRWYRPIYMATDDALQTSAPILTLSPRSFVGLSTNMRTRKVSTKFSMKLHYIFIQEIFKLLFFVFSIIRRHRHRSRRELCKYFQCVFNWIVIAFNINIRVYFSVSCDFDLPCIQGPPLPLLQEPKKMLMADSKKRAV